MNFSSTMNSIQVAESCLSIQSEEKQDNQTSLGSECPTVWDGFICWGPTNIGATVYLPCPAAKGSDVTKQAFRVCGDTGQWLDKNGEPDSKGWTNYTPCFTQEIIDLLKRLHSSSDEDAQTKIQIAHNTRILEFIGFSLSLAALLLSLFIFHYFRSLRNPRTRLHRHLFVAMVIQVAIRLTLYIDQAITRSSSSDTNRSVSYQPNTKGIDNTPIVCEAAYICLEYARTAMFMWMFVEGLYLHNMITVTVFEEKLSPSIYPLVGWVVPIPLTAGWAIITALHYGTATCWWGYNFTLYFWILEGPRLGVLMVNLGFLLNILRVLVTKLRQSNSSEAHQARYYASFLLSLVGWFYITLHDFINTMSMRILKIKAVKAALVLLPLLGLTNLLNMLDAPLERSSWEFGLWSYITHIFTSCQGLVLSFLYCFWNGEVQIALKKFIRIKVLGARKYGIPRNSVRMSVINRSQSGRSARGKMSHRSHSKAPLVTNSQGYTDTTSIPSIIANNYNNGQPPETTPLADRQTAVNAINVRSNNLTTITEELPSIKNHYVKSTSKLRLIIPPIFKYSKKRQRAINDISRDLSETLNDDNDVEDESIAFEISPLECHSQIELESLGDSRYRTASV